ncbi:pseudaminic acid synthase [Chloroflexota bacterium]
MITKVKIGERWVGEGEPTFIIAEAGANHDRKLSQAKQLIDVAVEAGANAVKFQVYSAETIYSKKTPQFSYLKELDAGKSTYDILRENELSREWLKELYEYCQKQGIIFLASPFDKEAIDQLQEVSVPAYKWASFEIVDLPLLKHVASKGKPMLLATGMCNLADIQEAVDTVYSTGNKDVILLHCTSLYPTKPNQVNLRMMDTIQAAFHLPVGLSDHTLGITIPVAAVARGACVVEKHFTLSRKLEGPDHPFALEPEELKQMVSAIREVEEGLGSSVKQMIPDEEEMARLGRRSLIARVDISKGARIAEDMLIIKRPGYGIRPKFLDIVVGREAKRDIEKDDIITWEMV